MQLKLLAKVKENSEAQNFNAILCNPWISSAMAIAMSIYRTLCVLVSLIVFPGKQGSNMLIIKTGELQNIPHLSFWVPIFAAAKGPFS